MIRTCLFTPLMIVGMLALMAAMFVSIWMVPLVIGVWGVVWYAATRWSVRQRARAHGYDLEE